MFQPMRLYDLFVHQIDLKACLLGAADLPPFHGGATSPFRQLYRILDAAVKACRGDQTTASQILMELPAPSRVLYSSRLTEIYLLSDLDLAAAYAHASELIDELSTHRISPVRRRFNPLHAADHALATRWAPALRVYLLSFFEEFDLDQIDRARADLVAAREAGLDSDMVDWLQFTFQFARARQKRSLAKLVSNLAEWKLFAAKNQQFGHGIEYYLDTILAMEFAGRFDEAIALADEVLALDSKHYESLIMKARILKRIGRTEESLVSCDRLIEAYPQDYAGYCLRSNAVFLNGDYDQALTDAERACAVAPENPNSYMARAFVFLQLGDYDLALVDFEKTLIRDPERYDALRGKGKCLSMLGRDYEALACFNALRRIMPDDPDLHYELADILFAAGYLNESEKACKACLQLDSQYVSAYVILGMIAMRKNEDDKARHLLTKAVALEPDNPFALNELSYLTHLDGDDDTAIELVNRAIEESPEYADALCNKGIIHYFRSEFDVAIQTFERTIRLAPDHVGAWVGKGNTLTQLCEFDEATLCYDQALLLDPENVDACHGKATLYRMIGLEEEAREWQEKAIRLEKEEE